MASVSQSRTEWVKKGDTVGGKVVTKGYLAQKGKPEKRVTAKVKLVTQTGSKFAGQSQAYKAGKKVTGSKPSAGVGGRNPSGGGTTGGGTSTSTISSGPSAAQIAARKAAAAKAAADKAAATDQVSKNKLSLSKSMEARKAGGTGEAAARKRLGDRSNTGPNYRNIASANRKDSAAALARRKSTTVGKPSSTVSENIPDIRNAGSALGSAFSTRLLSSSQRQKNIRAAALRVKAEKDVKALLAARKKRK